MSRYTKIKYINPKLEVRFLARWVYESWNKALEEHAKRKGTPIPPALRTDTQRLERECLAAGVCLWIEEHGLSAAREMWQQLLDKVPTSKFLQKGYENLVPNLSWLFEYTNKGRGLSRVLDGHFDKWEHKGRWVDFNEGV